jgi:hypothetical protein
MYPYPLGLPKGSVRATLTLLVSINYILLTIDEKYELATSLSPIVAVALSFYFGGRMRSASIRPTAVKVDASQRAWGLPAGTIRLILILLFGGAAAYLYYDQEAIPDFFIEAINLILGYLLGQLFTQMRVKIFGKDEETDTANIVDHIKAIGVVAVTAGTVYLTLADPDSSLLEDWIKLASIVLGFYFGSRK